MVFLTGSNGMKGENEIKKLLRDELQNIASVKGRQLWCVNGLFMVFLAPYVH